MCFLIGMALKVADAKTAEPDILPVMPLETVSGHDLLKIEVRGNGIDITTR